MVRSRTSRRGHRRGHGLSVGLRSIDQPRRRPAPQTATLVSEAGETHHVELAPRTLIVAVKPNCDGCQHFLNHPGDSFAGWHLLVITKDQFVSNAAQPLWRSDELFNALEISAAPFYVALDGHPLEIVGEGVVFAPEQVESELSSL